ncbi:hypothetical protein C7212DRAFT_347302 [Tuber magnatum]|uniref:Uncharacterized protein n=1 Tax=Tuber magnatum TaxID=42249 RepID=A0A317SGW6_9PEZI|nr:hypothetical protein C7212DRAFT_347302 [Tuber magnatum]
MNSGAKAILGVSKLDPAWSVDGERQLTVLKPIPTGPTGRGHWDRKLPTPGRRAPNVTFVQPMSPEFSLPYRKVYLPLYANLTIGQKIGYKGAILHGLDAWNMSAHAILKTFGNSNHVMLKVFQARFASMILSRPATSSSP